MDWQPMVLLGAYHGINPGMGWLFAVALGMQQGSARGVWRALPPIALGHAVAVSAVVVSAWFARLVLPLNAVKVAVAVLLMSLGLYQLWSHRHPRFGGMQIGFRDLAFVRLAPDPVAGALAARRTSSSKSRQVVPRIVQSLADDGILAGVDKCRQSQPRLLARFGSMISRVKPP